MGKFSYIQYVNLAKSEQKYSKTQNNNHSYLLLAMYLHSTGRKPIDLVGCRRKVNFFTLVSSLHNSISSDGLWFFLTGFDWTWELKRNNLARTAIRFAYIRRTTVPSLTESEINAWKLIHKPNYYTGCCRKYWHTVCQCFHQQSVRTSPRTKC